MLIIQERRVPDKEKFVSVAFHAISQMMVKIKVIQVVSRLGLAISEDGK